jgi:predicted flap endonuclease-1-like 5' DNA nuclease
MFNLFSTYPVLFSLLLQVAEDDTGLPWWVILLILILVIAVVIWALLRSAQHVEPVHVEHKHADEHEVHGAVEAAPASVEAVRAAPVETLISKTPAVSPKPDDLTLIEGIGPKIAGILKEAGIETFAQLAISDVEALRALLLQANLRVNDPTTWPEQARLAAAGDWDGFEKLTSQLKGGRRA